MKKFIDKLIERLEECKQKSKQAWNDYHLKEDFGRVHAFQETIKIVNQLSEETEKDPNWQTTRKYLDVKYFSKIRELSAKYNYPCENVPINFDWFFGLIDKIETQLEEEYNNDFCEWRLCDEEANVYDTTCRNPHILLEGSPSDNNYKFCPYCGKKIKAVE